MKKLNINGIGVDAVIKQAISEVISQTDKNKEPLGYAFITALDEYAEMGYKLSDLSWFKGTVIEAIERETEMKIAC